MRGLIQQQISYYIQSKIDTLLAEHTKQIGSTGNDKYYTLLFNSGELKEMASTISIGLMNIVDNALHYYVKADKGKKPPQYIHHTLASAQEEAKRLAEKLDCDCEILAIYQCEHSPMPF